MQNKLDNIKNYAVYYGFNQVQKLLNFDMLILEPKGHTIENLLSLKNAGKLSIAYFSAFEINSHDACLLNLSDDDFIKIEGEIAVNKEFDTFYMDISKENVQEKLINAANALLQNGYDGIFIDTIGDLDYIRFASKEKLFSAAGLIIKKIRQSNPEAILIQNNGFLYVCDYTREYLDGICMENPPCKCFLNLKWTYSAFQKLYSICRDYHIKVFLLQETDIDIRFLQLIIKLYAKHKGFLYYESKRHYTEIS